MRKQLNLSLKVLAGSAIAALGMCPNWAGAQTTSPQTSGSTSQNPTTDNLEEVTVTGYRKSLKEALDIKLSSDHIVDSLVAEDIGKLPDQNIAEALERIPGISVSTFTVNGSGQSAGEPTEITVRGFYHNSPRRCITAGCWRPIPAAENSTLTFCRPI